MYLTSTCTGDKTKQLSVVCICLTTSCTGHYSTPHHCFHFLPSFLPCTPLFHLVLPPCSASSQIFFLLKESELTPSGANLLDGRYAVFGYVVQGQDNLGLMKVGGEERRRRACVVLVVVCVCGGGRV